MKTSFRSIVILFAFSLIILIGLPIFSGQDIKEASNYLKSLPLYFIPNQGQVNQEVVFYSQTSKYTLWVTGRGLIFDFAKKLKNEGDTDHISKVKYERDISRLIFKNSNPHARIKGIDKTNHRINYFYGKRAGKGWNNNLQPSDAVLYQKLYPNIDLKVYGQEGAVEYDWLISPGGKVEDIVFDFQNVKQTSLDHEGNIIITNRFGDICHSKPVAYQNLQGRRIDVDVEFKRITKNTYRYQVGSYDKNALLIIDPILLVYSTYIGGDNYDNEGYGIVVDSDEKAYVVGTTWAPNFPTKNPYMTDPGDGRSDVFVLKMDLDRSGASSLIYSTYLGGSSYDQGKGIAVDSEGSVYITGFTSSTNYPTKGAYMTDPGDGVNDAFVTKLSPSGNSLVYSTYLGGSGSDYGRELVVDSEGCAYVTGYTGSTNYPTRSAYQGTVQGKYDIFVTKLSSAGNDLVYSTYLGGVDYDYGFGIAIDQSKNTYITGYTYSTNYPTKSPYMTDPSCHADAVVTKLSASGNSLIYSTYLGGYGKDVGTDIAVNRSGDAFLTGYTYSTNFPTKNSFMADPGDALSDAFVTRLSSSGNSLVYSTYLGGNWNDSGEGITVDNFGYAYVVGTTESTNFPTKFAYESSSGGWKRAFVTKFYPGGGNVVFSTYFGSEPMTPVWDLGSAIAVDPFGDVYITGMTETWTFATKNAYQDHLRGDDFDAFVSKFTYSVITVDLDVIRGKDKAWIIERDYADVNVTVNNGSSIDISFYRIFRSTEGGPFEQLLQVGQSKLVGGMFQYYDPTLEAGKTYTYTVAAYGPGNVVVASSDAVQI